jgi:hypothetical protein
MQKARPPKNFSLALFALIALLSVCFLSPAHAANPGRDDSYTTAELCEDSCDRERIMCMDSSGGQFETYGEPRHMVGPEARCDRAMRDCLHNCGKVSPVKNEKSTPESTGNH